MRSTARREEGIGRGAVRVVWVASLLLGGGHAEGVGWSSRGAELRSG